jgi:hypothetical protein
MTRDADAGTTGITCMRGGSRVTLPVIAAEPPHNLRAASAFAISLRTPYLWNGMMKKR